MVVDSGIKGRKSGKEGKIRGHNGLWITFQANQKSHKNRPNLPKVDKLVEI